MEDTITEFLLARIAEDEAAARDAMNVPVDVERTASVPQRADAEWRGYNPDGTAMMLHAPVSDAPDAPLDEIGHWGWNAGPVEADSDPESLVVKMFGPVAAEPDRPFMIGDSGLWDESDPDGATYFRAIVPASAGRGTANHIARHSPARVRAECKAERRIVKEARQAVALSDETPDDGSPRAERIHGAATAWEATLDILASVYADHPDFREEWRP